MENHPDGQLLPPGIEPRLETERLQELAERLLLQHPGIDLEEREQIEEGLRCLGIWASRKRPLRGFQLALFPRLRPREFAEATADLLGRLSVGILPLQVVHLPSDPELHVIDEVSYLLDLVALHIGLRVSRLQLPPQELRPLWADQGATPWLSCLYEQSLASLPRTKQAAFVAFLIRVSTQSHSSLAGPACRAGADKLIGSPA